MLRLSVMRLLTRRLPAVLTLSTAIWAATLPAAAVPSRQSLDPRKAVSAGSTTYLDLLRRLFPDATYDTATQVVRAQKSVKIRNIDPRRQPTELDSDIAISYLSQTWMRSDGRRLLLLTIHLTADDANEGTPSEGETTILGAFDLETGPRLIDALEVQTDRFAGLWDTQPLLHLTNDHDAVVVHNTHSNADESYDAYTLLFLDGGKFAVISEIVLFSTLGCGITYSETPVYAVIPHAGRKYPDVSVRVTVEKAADGNECERRTAGFTRTYAGTYTWDANTHRYVGDRGLASLDRFNRQRMG